MIAVDTNILVYAHREESPWHRQAVKCLSEVSAGPWAIPWPCLHEFLAVTTHPKIFDPPTPTSDAIDAVQGWARSKTLALLGEGDGYLSVFVDVLGRSRVTGPRVHDARIVALCIHHGITELWTADRDFSRYPELRVRNPLV